MAKKKEAAAPEQHLQEALVPCTEWPYKVPENWCWTYFSNISMIRTGKKDANYGAENGAYPFFTCAAEPIRCTDYSFDCNAILLAGNGDIGNITRYNGKFEAYQRTYVIEVDNIIDIDLAYYFFKYRWVDYNKDKMYGTAIPYIRLGNLKEFPFPLPPLPEQQRIVDRIESLFARLDEAKEKAQAALDSFEPRKAAILHKAFTGELTEKWRNEHGIGMESWKTQAVADLCASLKYGTAKKSEPTGKVVVIRMGNLQNGEIDWSDLAYSNDEDDIQKYHLIPGDVLFNRTNSAALVGKTSIYRGEFPAIYAGYLIKLDYDRNRITGDFLNYALNTVSARRYCDSVKTDGVNQSNINAKKIGAYHFEVPYIEEQQEIVRILDSLFAKEQQAKEAAEAVLDQIDLIKKSILSRAFRGTLGTNDPTEPSSTELIKKIFSEKLTEEKKPRQRRKVVAETVVKTIIEALSDGRKLTPEQLKAETGLEIGDFYDELKPLLNNGTIVETRVDGESYLEANHES